MRTAGWMAAAAACLMLTGCAARELEDRAFVQAMELDLQEGVLTGGFGRFTVQGEDLEDICKAYQDRLDRYLDLGHIRAIVLGEELLNDTERLQTLLLEMEQTPMLSRNSLVFSHAYEKGESYLARLEEDGEEPGEYLCDKVQNNPYYPAAEAVSLGDMLSGICSAEKN